jgi:hypothetical protein
VSDPGPKPELKWIDIGKLYVDQEYQRSAKSDRSKSNIAYMRQNFSWAFFGALVVCYVATKKQYAIIDGQHRYLVAQSMSAITEVPCLVINDLDIKKQAKSFVVMNTKRVVLHSLAAFHAAVAAGESGAVATKKVLDESGIEIPSTPVMGGDTGPRQTHSVGTVMSIIRRYTEDQVKWALTIIPEAYGEKRGMMRSLLIKALVEFRKQTPDADRGRMVKVLKAQDPAQLEDDARACVSIKGGTSVAAIVEKLDRLYRNSGRKNAA